MRVKPIAFGILVIAILAGTVGVAMAAGAWQTTGRTAVGGGGSGAGSGGGGGGGDDPQQGVTSGEVKGWMAIGDVAAAAGVDLPEMLAAFDLPADTPPETPLKELESDAFSVSALRAWLADETDRAGPTSDTMP